MNTEGTGNAGRDEQILVLYRRGVRNQRVIAQRVGVTPKRVAKVLRRAGEKMGWPEFARANGYRSTWK